MSDTENRTDIPEPAAQVQPPVRRDGVWNAGGLSADFQHLYRHPNCPDVHKIRTVSGDHYVYGSELIWD